MISYGPVRITKGKYKGHCGVYDDDEDDNKAIVYLGVPFMSEYVLVNVKNLEQIDEFLPAETLLKEFPDIENKTGVVIRRKK